MSTDSIIQSLSIIFGFVIFIITHILSKMRDRAVANRETYQILELASIELFRFEANHIEIIRPVWEDSVPVPPEGKAEHIVVIDYVCQILNLFEMAIRFRKEGVVPPQVFGSWVIWFYNLSNAPHFPEIWEEVRWDYTIDLREIINEGVRLKKEKLDEEERREQFFINVSKIFRCKAISDYAPRLTNEESLKIGKKIYKD